jgi:hypothetical protein
MYSVDNWRGFTLHKLPTVSLRWTVSLTFWEVNTICFFPLFLKMISSGLSWRVISYKLMIWKYGHMRWITFYLIGISLRLWVHMLNTIFNNNSVLAWWSVLLVEVVPEKTPDLPQISDNPCCLMYTSPWTGIKLAIYQCKWWHL